jgi:hypothetical protein
VTRRHPTDPPAGAVKPPPPPAPPTKNKVRQARREAGDEAARVPGIVVNLRTSAHGLEYIRRIVGRELREEIENLAKARPHAGQSPADFAAFYRPKEAKVAFLQDLVGAIDVARVDAER